METIFGQFLGGRRALGLLLLRLAAGAAFTVHGWGKVSSPGGMFHWMPPAAGIPGFFQFLAALSEFGGGMALIVGLLTPLACFGIACTMLVALFKVHFPRHDPFIAHAGPSFELALEYLAVALCILLAGPGAFSLDALIFGRRRAAIYASPRL
jgi:putative oxidoreductase